MRIPFSIKFRPQIESGEYKVVTRDGRPARIICWDRVSQDGESIVALVDDAIRELSYFYKNTGMFLTSQEDTLDLFIITPEPELTEFEKTVYGMITNKVCVKEWSKTLLDLARKQIEAEKKQSKRLPTIEEWGWLINNCEWKWDENRKGQVVTEPNGNSIFLPAAGSRDGASLYGAGSFGDYWSSSLGTGYPLLACYAYFSSGEVDWDFGGRRFGLSVRPVSDTPMEGFVDMGNNLFWVEKNVEGLYNYDGAMKLFNS